MLTQQSYDEFSRVIANFAGSHFTFAKYVLPAMRKSETSSVLFITGGVGKFQAHTGPNASPYSRPWAASQARSAFGASAF